MNQVATKQESNLSVRQQAPQQTETILKGDIVVPKLLLMQGLSDFVAERKKDSVTGKLIAQGDFVKSLSCEVVGGPELPVEIIPLTYINQWVLMEKVGNKYEFRRINTRDHGLDDQGKDELDQTGENLQWDFVYKNTPWKRVKSLGLYALLSSDVAAFEKELKDAKAKGTVPDFNKAIMPVMINFKSTSFNAGKKIVTKFSLVSQMAKYGAVVYSQTMTLVCKQDKNDKGTYYVMDVEPGRKCTPMEFEEAHSWHYRITRNGETIRVDESDDTASPTGGPDLAAPSMF